MDDTNERQGTVDNPRRCACGEKEEGRTCYVLMNSQEYGTEVWPCASLEEAIETLSRLARSAERHRQQDGIQRYFCILGEPPEASEGVACDTVSPDPSDTDALTLTLHFRETRHCREPEEVPCLRRFAREAEEVSV